MADKEFLGDRRRSQEEEYFQRQEQVLIAKMQERTRAQATRQALAQCTGVVDTDVLADLEALGYTPETVMLLHLVPLLHVAWAEGGVSDRERDFIIEAARASGVTANTPADRQLLAWLDTSPSADFFDRTLRVVGIILRGRPIEEREDRQRDLLSYCMAIASASGGILGFGKVSAEEERALARIAQALDVRSARSAVD